MQLGPPRFCANTKDNTIIDNHLIVEVGKVGESAAAAAIAERVRRGWGRLGWGRTLRAKDAFGYAGWTLNKFRLTCSGLGGAGLGGGCFAFLGGRAGLGDSGRGGATDRLGLGVRA